MDVILPDIEFQLCRRDSQLGFLRDCFAFNGKPLLEWCESVRPTIVLTAVVCWSTSCSIAVAQMQCVSFSDTIDGVNKDRAVEKSLKSLDEQIEKWKVDNGVTGPVTVTAERPQPHPFWRSSVPSYALLPPDVVSDTAYTICWTGVVSPVVCTSGTRVCW